jgi:hypothetical protein
MAILSFLIQEKMALTQIFYGHFAGLYWTGKPNDETFSVTKGSVTQKL